MVTAAFYFGATAETIPPNFGAIQTTQIHQNPQKVVAVLRVKFGMKMDLSFKVLIL
jgi:hypothetical protein